MHQPPFRGAQGTMREVLSKPMCNHLLKVTQHQNIVTTLLFHIIGSVPLDFFFDTLILKKKRVDF